MSIKKLNNKINLMPRRVLQDLLLLSSSFMESLLEQGNALTTIRRFLIEVRTLLEHSIKDKTIANMMVTEYNYCTHSPCCEFCWFSSETQIIWEIKVLYSLMGSKRSLTEERKNIEKLFPHPNLVAAFEHYVESPLVKTIGRYQPWGPKKTTILNQQAANTLFRYCVDYYKKTGLYPLVFAHSCDLAIYERNQFLRTLHNINHADIASIATNQVPLPPDPPPIPFDVSRLPINYKIKNRRLSPDTSELESNRTIIAAALSTGDEHLNKIKEKTKHYYVDS